MLKKLSTWLSNFLLFKMKDKWMSLSLKSRTLFRQAPDEATMRNASVVFMVV